MSNYWRDSFRLAVQLGICKSEYDEMTPDELRTHADVFREKKETENEDRITLVWMGEQFHRLEKLPPLSKILDKEPEVKQMTEKQMLLNVEQLNAMFGGEVIH